MKKMKLTLALAGLLAATAAYADTNSDALSTVQSWTGTGTNEAALEIDWNQGTSSDALIFGYRWNGSATAEQMLNSIVASVPQLYAEENGFVTGFGDFVFGLGYATTGDEPIQLAESSSSIPPLSFNSQHLALIAGYDDVDDYRTPVNAGDLWQEGLDYSGYWNLFLSTDSALTAANNDPTAWANAWVSSENGMGSTILDNDDVDAFDFSFYDGSGDSAPALLPVPEPSTWAMLGLGALCLTFIGRKGSGPANKNFRV
jgi:hypothetical protein